MGLTYRAGDKITAKKKHPCGGNVWTVIRIGADYKIKCERCGRVVMLTKDELDKMTKSVEKQENGVE